MTGKSISDKAAAAASTDAEQQLQHQRQAQQLARHRRYRRRQAGYDRHECQEPLDKGEGESGAPVDPEAPRDEMRCV